jgi:hypothetical protein
MESMSPQQIKNHIAVIKRLSARNKRDKGIMACITRRINKIDTQIKLRTTRKEDLFNELKNFKDRLYEKTIASSDPEERTKARDMLAFIKKNIKEIHRKYAKFERKLAKDVEDYKSENEFPEGTISSMFICVGDDKYVEGCDDWKDDSAAATDSKSKKKRSSSSSSSKTATSATSAASAASATSDEDNTEKKKKKRKTAAENNNNDDATILKKMEDGLESGDDEEASK